MINEKIEISKINTLADGTIRMQVDFNELSPDKIASLFKLKAEGIVGLVLVNEDIFNDFNQTMIDVRNKN